MPALWLLFFLWGAPAACGEEAARLLAVMIPVADIRSVPSDAEPGYGHDEANQTQVLYNELLVYRGEDADWYRVEAMEQREFSHAQAWQGYPGWIRKTQAHFIKDPPKVNSVVCRAWAPVRERPSRVSKVLFVVSGGTEFNQTRCRGDFCRVALADGTPGWVLRRHIARTGEASGEQDRRERIVSAARLLLKTPYRWGGRSFPVPLKGVTTGVDCSGLVNLAYRMSGVDVPRDAHEQWMVSRPVGPGALKPGDLIFVSKPGAFRLIGHVMLLVEKERFIEAPGTGQQVCISDFKTKFGLSLTELAQKDYIVSGKKIYFGRILP